MLREEVELYCAGRLASLRYRLSAVADECNIYMSWRGAMIAAIRELTDGPCSYLRALRPRRPDGLLIYNVHTRLIQVNFHCSLHWQMAHLPRHVAEATLQQCCMVSSSCSTPDQVLYMTMQRVPIFAIVGGAVW